MEKLKSNLPNMVGILTTVAVLCGGIRAYVNDLTGAARKEAAQNALNAGIEQVMGGKCKVEKPDTIIRTVDGKKLTYIAYKTDKGTAIQSTDPNGFGGNLTVLVGFNNAGDILGYTILETAETPGLGAKADKWFQSVETGGNSEKSSIIGKNPAKNQLRVTKDNDGGEIDAITASTITSRAFLRAVQEAYNTYAENK